VSRCHGFTYALAFSRLGCVWTHLPPSMLEGKYSTRRQFVKAMDRAMVVAPGPKTSKVNSLHKLMPCAVYSYQKTWMVGCRFFAFVSSAGNHIEMTFEHGLALQP
jgi:hypothetical protein